MSDQSVLRTNQHLNSQFTFVMHTINNNYNKEVGYSSHHNSMFNAIFFQLQQQNEQLRQIPKGVVQEAEAKIKSPGKTTTILNTVYTQNKKAVSPKKNNEDWTEFVEADILEHLNLPRALTLGSKQINQDTGLATFPNLLTRKKKTTEDGYRVLEIEIDLGKNILYQCSTADGLEQAYSHHTNARASLRPFYYNQSMKKRRRRLELSYRKGSGRLAAYERKISSAKKPIVFVGDRGHGFGSRIKTVGEQVNRETDYKMKFVMPFVNSVSYVNDRFQIYWDVPFDFYDCSNMNIQHRQTSNAKFAEIGFLEIEAVETKPFLQQLLATTTILYDLKIDEAKSPREFMTFGVMVYGSIVEYYIHQYHPPQSSTAQSSSYSFKLIQKCTLPTLSSTCTHMLSLEYLIYYNKLMEDSLARDSDIHKPYLYSLIDNVFTPIVTLLNLD
ncbi:hypothetical protein BD408DRAFT_444619 [Parasitella parasitica]|nr:hypothetical protein BD408DRAFT_444619 [Parasitella parasitica]